MKSEQDISGYLYDNADFSHAHGFLLPGLMSVLNRPDFADGRRNIFELGCGNGAIANHLTENGWTVAGVDPSEQGIDTARRQYPNIQLELGSAYDDLALKYGTFPIVISLEVVEHVYAPRDYAATLYSLVDKGGVAILSTPYHGYIKNLAMALTGKMDSHFTALWDHGHIKFWSMRTLTILLEEAGFSDIEFTRVGRIPPLAKSMIAIARKS
ncbi:MAG: class I SAM-dependent methyltransferase [Gammaproteobacteria bacterium]|nr:class I SAM-dependent methyltransferase [Gammaproteobacteria bacterium]NNL50489.1 class I SAM-dependent methyltransferase [Woeseiaceae bacterium]